MPRLPKKRIILSCAVLAVVAICIGAYAYNLDRRLAIVPTSATPSASQTPGADTATHAGPGSDIAASPKVEPTPSTAKVQQPTGQLLNTHSVSLSSGITSIDSTCNSVSGATCAIRATRGAETITVGTATTLSDGSNGLEIIWDAKKLSKGTWIIRAVASKGSQEAQSDPDSLVVVE